VDETFPDVGSMNDEELEALIDELTAEERGNVETPVGEER
jgi:hypothetical protein